MQHSQQKRPLLSSEDIIESLRNQNLELKIIISKLKKASPEERANTGVDEVQADLISHLLELNEELKKKLETKKGVDCACQTNIDSINIEELLKCRIALKKQREPQYTATTTATTTTAKDHQPKQSSTLSTDEKKVLENLYRVDGILTTALTKMRAAAELID